MNNTTKEFENEFGTKEMQNLSIEYSIKRLSELLKKIEKKMKISKSVDDAARFVRVQGGIDALFNIQCLEERYDENKNKQESFNMTTKLIKDNWKNLLIPDSIIDLGTMRSVRTFIRTDPDVFPAENLYEKILWKNIKEVRNLLNVFADASNICFYYIFVNNDNSCELTTEFPEANFVGCITTTYPLNLKNDTHYLCW